MEAPRGGAADQILASAYPRSLSNIDHRPARRTQRKARHVELAGFILNQSGLLQRGADRGEVCIKACSETVNRRDNSQRDASCNQAIFDGCGPRLVIQETPKKSDHIEVPVSGGSKVPASNFNCVKSIGKKPHIKTGKKRPPPEKGIASGAVIPCSIDATTCNPDRLSAMAATPMVAPSGARMETRPSGARSSATAAVAGSSSHPKHMSERGPR
jgi:hypothetical protein